MSGPFNEAPYPALQATNFGPALRYRVEVFNGGRTVVIGDSLDPSLRKTAALVQPGPTFIDVVIHGLPGRFVETLAGSHEIPAFVVAELLETQGGVRRGEPLRLICCHAAEAPLTGLTAAQALATAWGGPVVAPDGLLRVRASGMDVDLVDWSPDPSGGMVPNVTSSGWRSLDWAHSLTAGAEVLIRCRS